MAELLGMDAPERPSDQLSEDERAEALDRLRDARLLTNGSSVAQELLLDLYAASGKRIPNRVVGSAEATQPVPDATSSSNGRQLLRALRRKIEEELDIPSRDRSRNPY